ncbi:MAG TPA: hypothetical protein VFO12_03760 [Sphingomicrobium sp.]|nr:hypothetical protein [Sphingomicrobium sp.]
MGADEDRAFHLERAAQCRRMAEAAGEPAIRTLHEQLAQFHEAEAQRSQSDLAANGEPA